MTKPKVHTNRLRSWEDRTLLELWGKWLDGTLKLKATHQTESAGDLMKFARDLKRVMLERGMVPREKD